MTSIQVYPAIDMKGGKCVRLYQGDYEQETVYGDSPFEMAKKFADEGATWIHLVDLDGAKDGEKIHAKEVIRIARDLPVSVQVGGGIRTIEDVEFYLNNGVNRVIIGSLAISQPDLVVELIEEFGGDRIVIGLDAKDGMVATHGWLETSTQSAVEVGQYFASKGAKHIIFTDIATDGTLQGPNLLANKQLAEETGLSIIVSGGISSLEDIAAVAKLAEETSVAGVITGKALYNERFTLTEALQEVSN